MEALPTAPAIREETPQSLRTERSRSGLWILVGLFVLALAARIGVAVDIGVANPPVSDEIEYFDPAVSILKGDGYCKVLQQSADGIARPTAYRMPGPALILAAAFALFGPKFAVARITCAVASSFAAPLTYAYTRQISSLAPALIAGICCALYPSWVYYSVQIFSEPFFIPLLIGCLILTTRAITSRKHSTALIAGVAWGLATMIRPHALPIAALTCIYLAWSIGWRHAAMLVLGIAVVLAPWVVRNYRVFGQPVLLATEGGETFLGSNNPYVDEDPALHGMWLSPMAVPEYAAHLARFQNELDRNAEQFRMGTDYIRTHIGRMPDLAYYKLARWLNPVTRSRGLVRPLVLMSYGTLLVCLMLGILSGVLRRSVPLHLNLITTFAFTVMTVVYWGGLVRGRLPLEIIWIPWAAIAVCLLAKRSFNRAPVEQAPIP